MTDLDSQARARVGTVLAGKYRVEQLLGVGGMAAVYAATHLRNVNRVAVKVLHRELAVDANLKARFLREGYLGNVVEHPGIVRVLDDDTDEDGTIFLVMELLEGQSLQTRWLERGRKLDVAEVVPLMRDLLDVLDAAHARGVVHRDLKPDNLFVTKDGKLKVLDFGVARMRETAPVHTQSGALVGTPSFMPPEQALGRLDEVDGVSDVWAVGATAFTLLSGRYVHEGQTMLAAFIHAGTVAAEKLAVVAPHVPTPVAEVVDRALAFERSLRWPSARAMREALVLAVPSLPDAPAYPPAPASDASGPCDVGAPTALIYGAARQEPPLPPSSTVAGLVSIAEPAGLPSRKRTWRTLVTGGAVVAVVIAIGFAARARHAASGAPTTVVTTPLTPREVPAPSPTLEATADVASLPPPPAPSTNVAGASGAPHRTRPAATSRAPSRHAASADCSPPYVVDADGIKRWKRECPL